jgi:hypothetical protein
MKVRKQQNALQQKSGLSSVPCKFISRAAVQISKYHDFPRLLSPKDYSDKYVLSVRDASTVATVDKRQKQTSAQAQAQNATS